MNCSDISFQILGTRGSYQVSSSGNEVYGGDTSSIQVNYADKKLFLDLGSGISRIKWENKDQPIHVLLSHSHIDHIIGLISWSEIFNPQTEINIYAVSRNGLSCREQISTLFSAPLWPIRLEHLRAKINFVDIKEKQFQIDSIKVTWMESLHPNGSTIFKLNFGSKSMVYATDFEHSEISSNQLEAFSRDVDVMLYDAQFTEEEYLTRKGWGHSTWREGMEVARKANIGKLMLIHHDPLKNDEQIEALQQCADRFRIQQQEKGVIYPQGTFAKWRKVYDLIWK